ncbi:hypothetical protein FOA52_009274 [Chlamydomonas sp. UWO 241]|nr:hypothetical protein FOA52_009274 [Chlamydomonas sp. UWO 241]
MLRDDGKARGPEFTSTRRNITTAIQWLMCDLRPGTCLFFHFSGHGSQQRATGGDELDGMDETILPSDFKSAGQILDNELNACLVAPLPPGVVMHVVIDACHSGTALDLPYSTEFRGGQFYWMSASTLFKGTRGGTVLQFGACRDTQVAQDTASLSNNYTGAATFSFINALELGGPRQSYAQLMTQMSVTLMNATAGGNANASAGEPVGGVAGMMFGGYMAGPREPQTPVLSCDKPMDFNVPLMM